MGPRARDLPPDRHVPVVGRRGDVAEEHVPAADGQRRVGVARRDGELRRRLGHHLHHAVAAHADVGAVGLGAAGLRGRAPTASSFRNSMPISSRMRMAPSWMAATPASSSGSVGRSVLSGGPRGLADRRGAGAVGVAGTPPGAAARCPRGIGVGLAHGRIRRDAPSGKRAECDRVASLSACRGSGPVRQVAPGQRGSGPRPACRGRGRRRPRRWRPRHRQAEEIEHPGKQHRIPGPSRESPGRHPGCSAEVSAADPRPRRARPGP